MTSTPRFNRLLLAALTAVAGGASAQSSNVTIGGVVDAAVRMTHNSQGTLTGLISGGNSTSRITIRGTEDLGGGLTAGFWIESTLQTDTGVGGNAAVSQPVGQFWDWRDTVHVAGPFGEVRLGRDWTPVFIGYAYTDPFIFVGVGSMLNFMGNIGVSTPLARAFGNVTLPTTVSRSNNSVEYFLPGGLGGFNGQLMLSLGEGNNAGGGFRYRGGRFGYRAGAFDGSVFYGATRNDAQNADLTQAGASGSYNFGVAKLMSNYVSTKFKSSRQDHFLIGFTAPVGVAIVKGSWQHLDMSGTNAAGASIDANGGTQLSLGVDYYLSKRTVVYSTVAHLSNRGVSNFAIAGGPQPGLVKAGSSSTGGEIGLRHSF